MPGVAPPSSRACRSAANSFASRTVTTPRAPNSGEMPGYAKQLSNDEIAAVTNYIRNSWGNATPIVTPAQVAKARAAPPAR